MTETPYLAGRSNAGVADTGGFCERCVLHTMTAGDGVRAAQAHYGGLILVLK